MGTPPLGPFLPLGPMFPLGPKLPLGPLPLGLLLPLGPKLPLGPNFPWGQISLGAYFPWARISLGATFPLGPMFPLGPKIFFYFSSLGEKINLSLLLSMGRVLPGNYIFCLWLYFRMRLYLSWGKMFCNNYRLSIKYHFFMINLCLTSNRWNDMKKFCSWSNVNDSLSN